VKIRCCLCKALMEYEDKRVIETRYEGESVEYAVCEVCFRRLRNTDIKGLAAMHRGGQIWSKSIERYP